MGQTPVVPSGGVRPTGTSATTISPKTGITMPSDALAPSSPARSAARRIEVPAGTVECSTDGNGLAAVSMADNTWTSCVFADIVRQRYRAAAPAGGAVFLSQVYTPKFNRYWDLQCDDTEPVHCYAPADAQVVVYLGSN